MLIDLRHSRDFFELSVVAGAVGTGLGALRGGIFEQVLDIAAVPRVARWGI